MSDRRHVLIIEDDPDGSEALRSLLELQGHRVAVAASGQAGIDTAVRTRPDVIIIDLGLPDADGCDVARSITSQPGPWKPFVVAYSGYHALEDRARRAGCDAFVLKPEIHRLERLVDAAAVPDDQHRGPTSVAGRRREGVA
jgi:CheY-like chemotaxis protein